jgi:hypothetical protein
LSTKKQKQRLPCEVASGKLPLTFLARLLVKYGYVPFEVAGLSEAEVRTQLVTDMLMEIHSVQAYVGLWRGSTIVPEPERRLVADTVQEACEDVMLPWPEIEKNLSLCMRRGGS